MWELSKTFLFEAAHTLDREVEREPSRRIHGHSYRALVTVQGAPDPKSGMIVDLGTFEAAMARAREALDHRMLDDVADLGPATLENLAAYIWKSLEPTLPSIARVSVYRDSQGEVCTYCRDEVRT